MPLPAASPRVPRPCPGDAGRAFEATDLGPLLPWTHVPVRFLRRHPTAADFVLALAVGLLTLHQLLAAPHLAWWAPVLVAALVATLTLRRRHPYPVFWVVAAAAAALLLLSGDSLLAGPASLLALYTVAAHEPRRRAVVAAMVVEALALASALLASPGGQGAASVIFLSGLVSAALFGGTTLRTRRAYLASLEDRAERAEREREQQAQLAVVAERTRIAREMHDVVSHGLSVMVALADGAVAANRGGSASATEAMRLVSATGRTSMGEMRRLLGVLREDDGPADFAPQPTLAALDDLVEQVRAAGLPVTLRVSGTPRALPPTEETIIYRVVQEALTNAMRHAVEPTGVEVVLRWEETQVRIDVVDDGRGRPARDTRGGPGHGLTGMRERAAVFAGALSAGPRPGGGWAVRAVLPVAGNGR